MPIVTARTGVTAVIVGIALLVSGCTQATGGHPGVRAAPLAATPSSTPGPALSPVTSSPVTSSPVTSSPAATSEAPRAAAVANPCAGNRQAQLVLVSVATQHLWMCAATRLAAQTPVTTGASALPYDSTPTGTFEIQGRVRNTTLTLNTGRTYAVQYWIPFQGPLFGFHDSSWQTFSYGSSLYRTQGSHGCVHMPLAAIAFLYDWARIGATVVIH